MLAGGGASVLWWGSLDRIDLSRLNGLGLLACLPWQWYLALALAVLGPVLLLAVRPLPAPVMAAGHLLLILVLYGTTSAVYENPRFEWTYKHVAIVDYFVAGHPIDLKLDIYHNWPGFFLAAAELHRWTGIPVEAMAQWSEPFFAGVVALVVVWVVRGMPLGLATGRGGDVTLLRNQIAWATALLVTCANWIGQNYFSPQAVAFPLSLLVIGMLLRMIGEPQGLRGSERTFWQTWPGALVCLVTYGLIVVTHQLSPVMVLVQATVLAVVFAMRNRWLPVAFAALEAAWLVHAWGYISGRFDLVNLKGTENLSTPDVGVAKTLPWTDVIGYAYPALIVVLAALTLVGVLRLGAGWRRRPEARWLLAPVLLGAAPVSVILVQPYGHEGIFRAYLFALPWSALLIARGVFFAPGRSFGGWRVVRLALVPVLVALWLPTSFGAELDNYVVPSDVRTSVWASANTPPQAGFLTVTDGFPIPSTADYAQHRFSWETLNQPAAKWPGFAEAVADGPSGIVAHLVKCASWYPAPEVYLFLGPGQANHSRYYGDLRGTSWADLQAAVVRSGMFTLVHRDGDTEVWRYRGVTGRT